jgi:hypothetical protein
MKQAPKKSDAAMSVPRIEDYLLSPCWKCDVAPYETTVIPPSPLYLYAISSHDRSGSDFDRPTSETPMHYQPCFQHPPTRKSGARGLVELNSLKHRRLSAGIREILSLRWWFQAGIGQKAGKSDAVKAQALNPASPSTLDGQLSSNFVDYFLESGLGTALSVPSNIFVMYGPSG